MKPLQQFTPNLYLGQTFLVNFKKVKVIASMEGNQQHSHAMVQGGFAVMLKANGPFSEGLDISTMPAFNSRVFYVLRLHSVEPILGLEGEELQHVAHYLANHSVEDRKKLSVLSYEIFGVYYADANAPLGLQFSSDMGQISPAHHYGVFAPPPDVLHLIVNGGVAGAEMINFGLLRESETMDYLNQRQPVYLSMMDIRGKRSAMFGKTRLGKSNVVKLLAQGMLDMTAKDHSVGQLIFDVNGEYANDNVQDNGSLASSYAERCLVYYLSKRNENGSGKLLRFNLYERTEFALEVIHELLPKDLAESEYVRNLLSCRLPALKRDAYMNDEKAARLLRRIHLFWTILDDAGFEYNEQRLIGVLDTLGFKTLFNPCFHQPLRLAAYQAIEGRIAPPTPRTFREMTVEMTVVAKFSIHFSNDPSLSRAEGYVFDLEELIMARFLSPGTTDGPYVLRPCLPFHSPHSDNFIDEVLHYLDTGKTVIVDLGSANEQIIRYFAKTLSVAVFQAQEAKFVSNKLNDRYVQIYFEEAHMIFPPNSGNVIDVYSRFAKEGAKFNIGIVYSTQSPSTVNHDLLAQTENFFIGHLSSDREVGALASVQYAFKGREQEIMRSRSPGYMRMLSYSNRFVIPIQANRYTGETWLVK